MISKNSLYKITAKRTGLLFILLMAVCNGGFSQTYTLKAWLYEVDSFSRVPFAVVSIKNKMTATISDESGYIEMNCDLKDTLVVGHVGYHKMYLSIKKLADTSKGKIKIYLKRKNVELVPVTISGKRLSDEKKEEYKRHLERVRPTISSPISAIYESLSRRGKERSQMDAIYSELILRDQLETRLPPRKLYLITNDKSVTLDDLLVLCPVSSYFVMYASDYEFFYHFSRCWDEYKKKR